MMFVDAIRFSLLLVLVASFECGPVVLSSSGQCFSYDLTSLSSISSPFTGVDSANDKYIFVAPCQTVSDSEVPQCRNQSCPMMIPTPMYQFYSTDGCISCGSASSSSVAALNGAAEQGLKISFLNGDACPSAPSRKMAYYLICNTSVPANNPPEREVLQGGPDGYVIQWHTPLACPKVVDPSACPQSPNPLPTAPIARYENWEVGVIIHYNIATYSHLQGCSGTRSPPDISTFKSPDPHFAEQWATAMTSLGAKYAVYVAKHGCGFTTWPTRASLPGRAYNYTIQNSPAAGRDLVQEFVNATRAVGVFPGFYYSVVSNAYLRVTSGSVVPGPIGPSQAHVTQEEYESIVLQQLEELWSQHPNLGELWFDGGYQQSIQHNVSQLISHYQPTATAFGGYGLTPNAVRWVGTESGSAPYPNWCTGTTNGGDPQSLDWVPAEVDTTLQNEDQWFYNPVVGLRSLTTLKSVYHGSVGRNGNLLLDFAPQPNGLLPDDAMQAYAGLGQWIRACYGTPLINASGSATWTLVINMTSMQTLDRVMLQEDLTQGQLVRSFEVDAAVGGQWQQIVRGSSIGNKYIGLFADVSTEALRLRVLDAIRPPHIRSFAVFDNSTC